MKLRAKQKINLRTNEDGLVSFFVTIIIMIVLSLVVLGFSQISRKEETASLNRQLSTEAFYAAESGVNDAYGLIANTVNANGGDFSVNFPSETQQCTSIDPDPGNPAPPNYVSGGSNILNSSSNTKYSCLLVNPNPTTLTYTLSPGQAVVTELESSNNASQPLTTLDFNYSNSTQSGACPYLSSGAPAFPPNNQWPTTCPPVLRLDIVSLKAGALSVSGLAADTESFFIYPGNSGGTVNWTSVQNGSSYKSICSNTCVFSLSGLNTGGSNHPYYMRMQYVYGSGPTVNLTGYSGSTQISFAGGQIQIDATGVAQNVVRRIQVYVAETPSVIPAPNYAIQTNSTICKRITVGAGFYYENIPSIAPAEASLPVGSVFNNSPSVGGGASITDPCNPLY